MSNYRFNEWSKITKRFDNNSSNSSLWNDSPEEDEKEIKKIKQQWQKQQRKEFQRIKQQDFHRKNNKAVISSLITLAIVGVCAPFVPSLLKMTQQTFAGLFPNKSDVVRNDVNKGVSDKSPSLIQQVRQLEEKVKTENWEDNCTPTENNQTCQPVNQVVVGGNDAIQGNATQGNGTQGNIGLPNKPPTISQQVEDTVSQIKSRNRELKQAIDILDGKKVDRSQDILENSRN